MRRLLPALVLIALAAVGSAALAGAAPSTSTPPPTPVPPHGSPSPFPTVLSTPVPTLKEPAIEAASAVLEDMGTGQVLFSKHPDQARPVASLTKIMTAYLVLHRLRPSHVVTVSPEAAALGRHFVGISELGLRNGEQLTVRDLLEALLLQSANDSAVALADAAAPTTEDFITAMNRTAARLGLKSTKFYSPNGLDDRGHTTARSLATLTRLAEHIPLFAKLVRTKFASLPSPPNVKPRNIQNRNVLLWLYPGAVGVKTGFTNAAGYCLVAAAHAGGQRLIAVILGAKSSADSFSEAATLLNYGFHSFVQEEVVTPGQSFHAVAAGMRYLVAATAGLNGWVVSSAHGAPKYSVRLTGTPAPGTAGTVTARVRHLVVGSAPVAVTAVLGPVRPKPGPSPRPSARPRPWWSRQADALGGVASDLYHSVFG